MNVVFFGTPLFAIPALDAICASRHRVVAVISQPDRAKDRKGRLLPTPVAEAAKRSGLRLFQFASVKKEGIEILKSLNADIFVTAAYGQLLSQEILDIPRFGVINVHASLLPKYRGSSPIHHAILSGDKKTGVTIMQTRLALDSGEIILQAETMISPDENTESLTKRLSESGADLLIKALNQIDDGTAEFLPQREDEVVFCAKITSATGKIDWKKPAGEICNLIRAVSGSAMFNGRSVKITKAAAAPFGENDLTAASSAAVKNDLAKLSGVTPGEILAGRRLLVKCGTGVLEILEMVPAGGKLMSGEAFKLGLKTGESARFE